MLIDTSVLVAIHNQEAGFEDLLRIIANAKRRWLSVASYVEFTMVTKNPQWVGGLLNVLDIELQTLSGRDAEEAIKGFFRYGKGMHPANLNFGDCLVYGTTKATGVHLLFKGNDFSQTDISSVTAVDEEEV